MLQVTDPAREYLSKIRHERDRDAASARFVENPDGEGVSLTFATGPMAGDDIVHADGMDVLVAPGIAQRLRDSIIDVGKTRDGKPCLMLKSQPKPNPVTG